MGTKSAPTPPPAVDYARETKLREQEQEQAEVEIEFERKKLMERRQSGRYSLLRTGGEGLLDEAEIETKSLLGSGKKAKKA